MNLPTKSLIRRLAETKQAPCISLYMNTRKGHPENSGDGIIYKNLYKQVESSLFQKYDEKAVKPILEPLKEILDNKDFWNDNDNGLCILRNNEIFEVIRLPEKVEETVVVADSFHTKPIRHYIYSVQDFQVLGLSMQDFVMFEGNRYALMQIELPQGLPLTLTEVLGEDLTADYLYLRSEVSAGSPSGVVGMVHGYSSKPEEVDKDIEKYFRYVANFVHENFSKPSGLPLILAALPEHHGVFGKVNKNPFLLEKGIQINPKAVTNEQLADMAWKVIEPVFDRKLALAVDLFGEAKAKGLGSEIVEQVARAAIDGRVDTLLIEENRMVPGKIVQHNEIVSIEHQGSISNPEVDDLLDDVGEWVTKTGGKVLVLPSEKMPSETGVAAVFRY